MMTREQRLKDREMKRILHEEELKKLQEDSQKLDKNEARLSERHLKNEMERAKNALEKLKEDDWMFDCSGCGLHGENLVCVPFRNFLDSSLTQDRTMATPLYLVMTAECGSTPSVLVSMSPKRNIRISPSFARTASAKLSRRNSLSCLR
jgi:hypothetical protein